MSCFIDGCKGTNLTPVRTFMSLPGNDAKVKVRFEACATHHARFFEGIEATGKAPGVQRSPPTESEAVNLIRDLVQSQMPDPRKALGQSLYTRTLRFLKRAA